MPRGADSPESGGQIDALGILTTQIWCEPAPGHKRLYHRIDKVSQRENPAEFPKKPAEVLAASLNETQNSFENKILIPPFLVLITFCIKQTPPTYITQFVMLIQETMYFPVIQTVFAHDDILYTAESCAPMGNGFILGTSTPFLC